MQKSNFAICNQSSAEFEILAPEELQPVQLQKQIPKQSGNSNVLVSMQTFQQPQQQLSMSIVVEDQTYLVLEEVGKGKKCSPEEWKDFIERKKEQLRFKNNSQSSQVNSKVGRLSFSERHTVLKVHFEEKQKRMELWSIIDYCPQRYEQFQKLEEYQTENKQQRCVQLSRTLPKAELRALKKGIEKGVKLFKQIVNQNISKPEGLSTSWLFHLKELRFSSQNISSWIERILQRCALDFNQVRYCKGLQYICIGIIFSFPSIDIPKYSQIFYHFMKECELQQLYLESSPRFYSQLYKICSLLKEENKEIHNQIQTQEGITKNLFITYFRSCLLYRNHNPEVIRKIFELLLVDGISVIKVIVLRILALEGKRLINQEFFLEKIASFLLKQYFEGCLTQKQITKAFIRLFQV